MLKVGRFYVVLFFFLVFGYLLTSRAPNKP